MDPSVVTFHLGLELGIGVIGPAAFYIYLSLFGFGTLFYSPLWASIESRNGFDCPFF